LKQIADRVTVLRDGEYVGTVDAATTSMATIIVRTVREPLDSHRSHQANAPTIPLFQCTNRAHHQRRARRRLEPAR
jgi:ribose transport system ATP-binding protein